MRIILTEDEVADALENYISDQIVLNDNQKISIELTADGSAAVDIRSTGAKPKAKATTRKTSRSAPKKADKVDPKETANQEDQDTPDESPEPTGQTDSSPEQEDQTEASPEPSKPVSSIFGGANQSQNQDSDDSAGTPSEPPAKREGSIFSKVG